jgi:hypothetical protein
VVWEHLYLLYWLYFLIWYNNMKGIKAFVKHLKEEAPKDHILAYISNEEAKLLKSRGGSGKPYKYGILSFFASSPGDTGGAGGADGAGGNDASGGGGGGESTPSPGDTGGAGGVGPGSEPDQGSGDTGPGGSPTAIGPSHTGYSGLSVMGNFGANIASNPLSALSPVGTMVRSIHQTNQFRSALGLRTPQAPMGTEGDDDRQTPYTAVTPSTASSSLGSAPPSFFNLSSQPVSSYSFQPLGNPYNYQNPNLYRFNKGGIVDLLVL